MSEQMKPGDAVLVRVTYEDDRADGTWAWAVMDPEDGSILVRRALLTTEAAIRADERRRVAEKLRERLEADAVRHSGWWRVNEVLAEAMRMVDGAVGDLEREGGAG